jgi:transposase InsO family protein
VKFRFIQEHAHRFRINVMCAVLDVSRSGYYAWRSRCPSRIELANQELLEHIRAIFFKSRQRYGYRKVHAQLVKKVLCSRNRVARLMRLAGLRSRRRRRYRLTTQSRHRRSVAPNLLARQFTATAPNQKWVTDITYIPTDEGWLYLSAIVDLYSRMVVGWAMETYLLDRLTIKALKMALGRRHPPVGLLHHSDRGVQFASGDYLALLDNSEVTASMSRTGDVYDNAPMESFFATLKTELVNHRRYRTRREAKVDIFEFIEVFYNRQRIHAALQYQTPLEFESSFGFA